MTTPFKTWHSIQIGDRFTDDKGPETILFKDKCAFGGQATDLLAKLVSAPSRKVNLVRVTPRQLGCSTHPTYEEICQCAENRGLHKSPAQTGFRLAQKLKRLRRNQRYIVGMEAVMTTNYTNEVFCLEPNDQRFGATRTLTTVHVGEIDKTFDPDVPWVFEKPSK
jgi:hypothetical protein